MVLTTEMGLDRDYVDVEPAPEDLLTIWGHEVSAQNLERYFPKLTVKSALPNNEEGADPFPSRSTLLDLSGALKADYIVLSCSGGLPRGEGLGSDRFSVHGPLTLSSGPDLSVFPPLTGGLEDVVASCGLHV